MTFSTEKNKLYKIWNNSIENQFQIDDKSSNNKIIFNKISDLNNTNMTYNSAINLSSDWIEPEIINLSGFPDFNLYMFKEFEIIFNGINKNLIPYITGRIIYRLGNSTPSVEPPIDGNGDLWDEVSAFEIKINDFIEIKPVIPEEDEEVDENLRNITYRCSIFLEDGINDPGGLPGSLQFKFFANIFNPNYYQST